MTKENPELQQLQNVMDEILTLKIQGATAVANEGVMAFSRYAANSSLEGNKFWADLLEIRDELLNLRVTEPALRNGLQFVLKNIKEEGKEMALEAADKFSKMLSDATIQIANIGAERIQADSTILTHCHSSIVVGILVEASKTKKFRVISTETRPKWQGRKTARKLVEAGIEVTQIVDSAMRWAIKRYDVDIALVGADAITVEGTMLNKIGTRLLALACKETDLPLYCCTTLLKYDSQTLGGALSEIEMRDSKEIWENPPQGLKIVNPAFESTSRDYIAGFITEYGVIPPQGVFNIFHQELEPLILEKF